MSDAETAALLAKIKAEDQAYAEAEAIVQQENEYWDGVDNFDDEVAHEHDEWRELRKAALNHRGQP
jgi:hypothetical protein